MPSGIPKNGIHNGWFKKGSSGFIGKHTEETKMKIGKANKGRHHTDEERKKISEAFKKQWKSGTRKPPMSGKKHSEKTKRIMSEKRLLRKKQLGYINSPETRLKISSTCKGRYAGDRHPNWQGGISFEPYTVEWTDTLKRSIKERDHYICCLCKEQNDLVIHHINYDKKNCNPNNLITLCNRCNIKVNANRDYWTNYFNNILENPEQ